MPEKLRNSRSASNNKPAPGSGPVCYLRQPILTRWYAVVPPRFSIGAKTFNNEPPGINMETKWFINEPPRFSMEAKRFINKTRSINTEPKTFNIEPNWFINGPRCINMEAKQELRNQFIGPIVATFIPVTKLLKIVIL
jgi:hypothetical protein